MPKLTAKQEGFAQAIALANPPMSLADAYRANYDTQGMAEPTLHQCASRLASDPKITARVAVLEQEQRALLDLGPRRILRQLDEDRAFAQAHDDSAVALKATEATADLGGDLLGRRKHAVDSRSLSIDVAVEGLSVDELRSLSDLGRQARALESGTATDTVTDTVTEPLTDAVNEPHPEPLIQGDAATGNGSAGPGGEGDYGGSHTTTDTTTETVTETRPRKRRKSS